MEETMQRVPLLKEIVDYYSGPDRVTAKQQQGELERVANTIPQSAPNSVKQFTDRAVLSLQVSKATLIEELTSCIDLNKLLFNLLILSVYGANIILHNCRIDSYIMQLNLMSS